MKKTVSFLFENSLFLMGGAVVALIWANMNHAAYAAMTHVELFRNPWIGEIHNGYRVVTLHYLVNDILMAIFFALAGKEVWEARLPGGPLHNFKSAATPLIATLGGVAMPAAIFLAGAYWMGGWAEYGNGWAIPCATDIAFSYLVARLVFGPKHSAIPFLLLLAIADDAIGLAILAIFYPQEEIQMAWMLLPVLAMLLGWAMTKMRFHSFWWYLLICGPVSWVGFAMAGLHPALGLLPIIPVMPHAHADEGLFNWKELGKHDTLNEFEHWWKNPTELILGLFGLVNAGVVFSSIGTPTYLVLAGLFIGKPLGIWGFGMIASKGLKLGLPPGMDSRDLFVLSCAAAIGFTVALFVATVAFPAGTVQDAAKMGALLSFAGAAVTFVAAKSLRIKKVYE